MVDKSQEEKDLIETAHRVLPAGNFGNVARDIVIRKGEGGKVWDVSGNEFVDYLLGSGPMLIGHNHPAVTEAVQQQIPNGTTYFANNEHGILLAAEIVDAMACAEKVRFVSSGSEATFYAMRAARAHAGKDKILKFEGGFHGMSDYALMSMAPKRMGNFPQGEPDSAGIPKRVQADILIAPFNDADAAAEIIRENKDELAGVIVEPFQRLIPPAPGFLQALRDVTSECGVTLIFDEVVTGFRFAYGGAQEFYGVVPDMCALGKVCGGGFPLAAIAGRADIMAHFDKSSVSADTFLPQIGTLSGNPVAAVAGLATLGVLKQPGTYEKIFETGKILMDGLSASIVKHGIAAQVVGVPPLFDVFFTADAVRDYRSSIKGDAMKMAAFDDTLHECGLLKGPSKFYVSLAHDENDIAKTLAAFDAGLAAAAAR